MTRGRPPNRGISDALPFARARGLVMEIRQNGETPAELVISADGKVVFVRIRRAEPFRRTPEELDAEHRESLTQLRAIPGSATILREFWAYSKYGTWRFFRVEDTGLVENGRDGRPLGARGMEPVLRISGKIGQGAQCNA